MDAKEPEGAGVGELPALVVLEGLEPVRRRPGMYIGDVHDGSGLHHLVWEVVGNTIDQHLAKRATQLRVDVADGWVTVEDDGPGIPVVHDDRYDLPTLEAIFTRLSCHATWDGHFPHIHLTRSMRGVGLGAVSALCARVEVESRRDGARWRAAFERGVTVEPLSHASATSRSGTRIRFRPDPTIFSRVTLDLEAIGARLRELAWLFPLLTIRWQGVVLEPTRQGLAGWVRALARGPLVGDLVVTTMRTLDDTTVEIALGWDDAPGSRVQSLVNASTTRSGTHERGLRTGLLEVARALGCTASDTVVRELVQAGLVAVVHVGLLDPSFGSPNRDHLVSPIAEKVVRRAIVEAIPVTLRARPALETFLRARLRS